MKQYSIVHGQIHVTLCSTFLLNNKNYNTCFLTICFFRLYSELVNVFGGSYMVRYTILDPRFKDSQTFGSKGNLIMFWDAQFRFIGLYFSQVFKNTGKTYTLWPEVVNI